MKLRMVWPGVGSLQVIASSRSSSDSLGDAGWCLFGRGGELIVSIGQFGSREVPFFNFLPDELEVWVEGDFLVCRFDEQVQGIHLDGIGSGDDVRIGEDPQVPWARFRGEIEVI